ncbi:hypothetical protein [Salinigranum rubrum]|uniref:hypothetical protein n=1 Tax=Salinigranum rubrum TaxID=755307 RepID=UPI001FE4B969|nr:hypothetical protein [Salinigranum rubrum]
MGSRSRLRWIPIPESTDTDSLNDIGATAAAPLVVIGDELGLYETFDKASPLTSGGLAEETDTAERYVREWLRSQAAGGYVINARPVAGFDGLHL